jgi:hypothetical protein
MSHQLFAMHLLVSSGDSSRGMRNKLLSIDLPMLLIPCISSSARVLRLNPLTRMHSRATCADSAVFHRWMAGRTVKMITDDLWYLE